MFDDYTPAETPSSQQNNRSSDSSTAASRKDETREEGGVEGVDAAVVEEEGGTGAASSPSAKRATEWAQGGDAKSGTGGDHGERRTKTLIITGSAGGWVEVWEAKGIVAAAGVDE